MTKKITASNSIIFKILPVLFYFFTSLDKNNFYTSLTGEFAVLQVFSFDYALTLYT